MRETGMKLDRKFQNQFLNELGEHYPRSYCPSLIETLEKRIVEINVAYLTEHGLIERQQSSPVRPTASSPLGWRITKTGIDFLQDDGGLSAILGTVVVKLHAETVRELLEAHLLKSKLSHDEKNGLTNRLRQLPADAIGHLSSKLLEKGLDHLPDAAQTIQKFLQSLPLV